MYAIGLLTVLSNSVLRWCAKWCERWCGRCASERLFKCLWRGLVMMVCADVSSAFCACVVLSWCHGKSKPSCHNSMNRSILVDMEKPGGRAVDRSGSEISGAPGAFSGSLKVSPIAGSMRHEDTPLPHACSGRLFVAESVAAVPKEPLPKESEMSTLSS